MTPQPCPEHYDCRECAAHLDQCLNAARGMTFDQAFLVGVEFGYKQAEKGHNIQQAIINATAELHRDIAARGIS